MPYKLADRAIAQLNKAVLRRADKAKQKLIAFGFDELNVITQTDALYADITATSRKKFIELYVARFKQIYDADDVYELAEMYVAFMLEEPNDATHYAYDAEVSRKRDRAKEAILSVPTKAQKQLMLEKHIRYFLQMADWYMDFSSQGAEIAALKAKGVKKVQRHEMNDGKTCGECRDADGAIYDINKIPPIPHVRCRRWFTPA